MLIRSEVRQRARSIVPMLVGLQAGEAMHVLGVMAELVGRRAAMAGETDLQRLVPDLSADLVRPRRRGRPSKIDKNPEIRAFLHSLMGNHTFTQMTQLCLERFGPDEAPSRSAIARYSKDMRKELAMKEEHNG